MTATIENAVKSALEAAHGDKDEALRILAETALRHQGAAYEATQALSEARAQNRKLAHGFSKGFERIRPKGQR